MNKIIFKKIIYVFSFLIILTGCNFKRNSVSMTGSTTLLPIAQKCAEAFAAKYKDITINIMVSGGGSSVGITALIDNRIDIANSSRKIKESEIMLANKNKVIPYEYEIAKDAIVVIINPELKMINNFALSQLKDIYTGKIKNWKDLGGPDKSIVVISRDSSSGTFESFDKIVMKNEKVLNEALMLASNNSITAAVSTTPYSIGYIGIGYMNSENIKVLSIDGVMPSKETVLKNKYKISRGLYMYTNGKAAGNTELFINFVLSLNGQRLIADEGFLPVKI